MSMDTASSSNPIKHVLISNKFRFFVILSFSVHFGIAIVWGVHSYLQRENALQVEIKKEAARQQMAIAAKERTEKVRQGKISETKNEIAEGLKKDLSAMIKDQADGKTQQALGDRVLKDLEKPLSDYAKALLDPNATDEDLRNFEGELQRDFVQAADEQFRDLRAEAMAADFINHVKTEVVPKIAEHYTQAFDQKVVTPLGREAEQFGSQAQREDQARRSAVMQDLNQAKSAVAQAAGELKQAHEKLNQARGGELPADALSLAEALSSIQDAQQAAAAGKAQAKDASEKMAQAATQKADNKQATEQQAGTALSAADKKATAAKAAIAKAVTATELVGAPAADALKKAAEAAGKVGESAKAGVLAAETGKKETAALADETLHNAEVLTASLGEARQMGQAALAARENGTSLADAVKSLQAAQPLAARGKSKALQAGATLTQAAGQKAAAKSATEQSAAQALREGATSVAEASAAVGQSTPVAERLGGAAANALRSAVAAAAKAGESAKTSVAAAEAGTPDAAQVLATAKSAEAFVAAIGEAQKSLQTAATSMCEAGTSTASAEAALTKGQAFTAKSAASAAQGPEALYAHATASANEAMGAAVTAVQAAEKEISGVRGLEAQRASREAEQALGQAQQKTQAAIAAVGQSAIGKEVAKAAIESLVDDELRGNAKNAFEQSLEKEAVPRLTQTLGHVFREKIKKSGFQDEALAKDVEARIGAMLDEQIGGENQAGALLEKKFKGSSGVTDEARKALAASATGQALAGKARDASDKLLKDNLPGIAKDATADHGFSAVAGRWDGHSAGQELTDKLAKLSEGFGTGRITHALGGNAKIGMLQLRQNALARADGSGSGSGSGSGRAGAGSRGGHPGVGRGSSVHLNAEEYQRATDLLKDRDKNASQGAHWKLEGAEGDAARASRDEDHHAPALIAESSAAPAMATISNQQPYQPTFKCIRFAAISCLNKPFAMDGDFVKWKALPALEVSGEKHVDGQPDKQLMQIAWDPTGLYFHFLVKKPGVLLRKVEKQDFPNGDGVEVWVDTLNSKEKSRDSNVGQQFWFWPFGSASDPGLCGGESIFSKKTGYHFQSYGAAVIQRAAKVTPDGWEMECKIPAERLWDADLAPGRILGLNAYVNTGTLLNYYWATSKGAVTFAHPNTWGDVLLAGSDGDIQVVDAKTGLTLASSSADASKAAARKPTALVVGEPLRLRVTDRDMSVPGGVRGKVQVTVRTRHGKPQTAVLEETAPGSGVFEGAVKTALALDEEMPGTLSLYEGDLVDISYHDQARANGARNAEVRFQVRTGAAVMAQVRGAVSGI